MKDVSSFLLASNILKKIYIYKADHDRLEAADEETESTPLFDQHRLHRCLFHLSHQQQFVVHVLIDPIQLIARILLSCHRNKRIKNTSRYPEDRKYTKV